MHSPRPRTVLIALAAAVSLTSPASAQGSADPIPSATARASELRPPRPCLRQPPLFTLQAKFWRSYTGEVHMNDPRARCSRLDRVEVDWGDGTRETKQLNPLILYQTIGLRHRFPGRPTAARYVVTVTLHDEHGTATTRAAEVWIWAEWKITVDNLRFTSVGDCDPVGEGDFDLRYRFELYADGRRFDSATDSRSIGLGPGDSALLAERLEYLYTAKPESYLGLMFQVDEGDPVYEIPNEFEPATLRRFRLFPGAFAGRQEHRWYSQDCQVMVSYDLAFRANL